MIGDTFYNCVKNSETATREGFTKLGVHNVGAIFTRAVLIDVAAFKGGFAVRVAGKLYFYNNAGELQGDPVAQATSGENFDGGRGDGTRLGGHINQPWVFLAGRVVNSTAVRVAIWDARTRTLATLADVSEGGFRADADRAVVSADGLGRFTVAWVSKPDGYEAQQVAARVFEMDEATKTVKPLTPSFLPFVNASPVGGIRSVGMSVAMTTQQILVAAKGEINLQNKPEQGANSTKEINFYTVISHPAPKTDTTPAAGGSTTTAPRSCRWSAIHCLRAATLAVAATNSVPMDSPPATRSSTSGSRPQAITVDAPLRAARLAASTLVIMPPVPMREPAPPAIASSAGSPASATSMKRAAGSLRGSAE